MAARTALGAMAFALLAALTACGDEPDIRTLADFDDAPCALFPAETMTSIVSPPYIDLAGVNPAHRRTTPSATGGDTFACTYTYEATATPYVPQVASLTVTVAHTRSGSQPYSICVAGATARAGGYRIEKIGDQACLSPSGDLWLKLGDDFFHVVVVPQPGFTNPVEASQALSPLILDVARATAAHMPRKAAD